MPDEYRLTPPRPDPERIDLAAIKTDLEFLIERVSKLPTRREQALKPLYVMVGSAGIVIAWIELFGVTASDSCRSFGASQQSRRYSPSFLLLRGDS